MQNLPTRVATQYKRSRVMLYGITLPILALSLAGAADSVLRVLYVVLGFSLIIFLHELGHFLVARACSVKCLAFSIGIGPRVGGWRKGAGWTFGADPFDPDAKNKHHTLEEKEAATTRSDLPTTAEAPKHPPTVGDTDYRISWLPLGGYVRMLGQDDMDPTKISNDPRAFNQRPVWQRMCIVSAGVIMNLIFAAVTFSIIFSPGIGVDFPPAVVGQVAYDSPAWKAGIRMGDEILSVDGKKPRGFLEFTDVMMASALSDGAHQIALEVKSRGAATPHTVNIIPQRNDPNGFLSMGFESLPGLKIAGSGEEYAKPPEDAPADPTWEKNKAELAKIRTGDIITAVNGKPLVGTSDGYIDLYQLLQTTNGQPITLTLDNKDKKLPSQEIHLYPRLEPVLGVAFVPPVFGLLPPMSAGEVLKGSAAAAAGVKEGDIILRVGDRTNPTPEQFKEAVVKSPGQPLQLVISRDGKEQTLQLTPKNVKGDGVAGLVMAQETSKLAFVVPDKQSEASALDLPIGSTITAVDGKPVATWQDMYASLRGKDVGSKTELTFSTPSGTLNHTFALSSDDLAAIQTHLHYQLGLHLELLTRTQVAKNTSDAMIMGMEHTWKFVVQVYQTLAGLFRQTVSPSNLHGIVGITKVGYDVQQRGPVWLWYILALVSVNLAVANFLPLPIVDGGLFLLLILEKIRGKPLSLKVQSAIQVVGIVLLAGLFLFVTFNDFKMF